MYAKGREMAFLVFFFFFSSFVFLVLTLWRTLEGSKGDQLGGFGCGPAFFQHNKYQDADEEGRRDARRGWAETRRRRRCSMSSFVCCATLWRLALEWWQARCSVL